jgi:hypothetical protein
MDIRAGIIAAALLLAAGAYFSARSGIRAIQFSRKMTFYRLRRARAAAGWRMIGLGLLMLLLAAWLPFYGEPLAYQYFPPSPTPSSTPTITLTPTITMTPTITETPTLTFTPLTTDTPTPSPTPFLPPSILVLFESQVTPNPGAVFSPLLFSTEMAGTQAVEPRTVFQNPIKHIYATFSYDQMEPGAQWTALWYRDGNLVHFETKPWDGTTGGFGYTDWAPPQDEWLPGIYEVQIFVGEDWKVVGRFILQGDPPTATPTITATATKPPTGTHTSTSTPVPSRTPTPSATPKPPTPPITSAATQTP